MRGILLTNYTSSAAVNGFITVNEGTKPVLERSEALGGNGAWGWLKNTATFTDSGPPTHEANRKAVTAAAQASQAAVTTQVKRERFPVASNI
ncbi:MAG: hypothetical protein Q9172_001851 [Xanthocarpia lactea]